MANGDPSDVGLVPDDVYEVEVGLLSFEEADDCDQAIAQDRAQPIEALYPQLAAETAWNTVGAWSLNHYTSPRRFPNRNHRTGMVDYEVGRTMITTLHYAEHAVLGSPLLAPVRLRLDTYLSLVIID